MRRDLDTLPAAPPPSQLSLTVRLLLWPGVAFAGGLTLLVLTLA